MSKYLIDHSTMSEIVSKYREIVDDRPTVIFGNFAQNLHDIVLNYACVIYEECAVTGSGYIELSHPDFVDDDEDNAQNMFIGAIAIPDDWSRGALLSVWGMNYCLKYSAYDECVYCDAGRSIEWNLDALKLAWGVDAEGGELEGESWYVKSFWRKCGV